MIIINPSYAVKFLYKKKRQDTFHVPAKKALANMSERTYI